MCQVQIFHHKRSIENYAGKLFLIVILLSSLSIYAQESQYRDSLKTLDLQEVNIQGSNAPSGSGKHTISRKQLQVVQAGTLGETLSHVPGVQNSYFGPNSGTPVIRSLSGNRVKVLSNGLSISDLAGVSPNLNLIVDMDNTLGIDVHKSDASIIFGGRAIGGAVNIKDNTVPKRKTSRALGGFVTAAGGTNSGFRQAVDLNGNTGKHWVWHFGAMNRFNKDLRIPGNTKAPIAFDPSIDPLTQTMAQVNVETQTIRNLTLYPYLSQFVIENLNNPEWALSEADIYTFQENSVIGGVVVPNPGNLLYIPGQPAGTPLSTKIVKGIHDYAPVVRGIMPNSHSKSYALNLGTSYIGDSFSAGLGYKRSYGYYGIPGFALPKLPGHTHTHDDGYTHEVGGSTGYLPINTRSASNSILLESQYRPSKNSIESIRMNYVMQWSDDSELIVDYLANMFTSTRQVARLEVDQRVSSFLKGTSGLDYASLKLIGSGEQRYLPDNSSNEYGLFTLQQITLKPVALDLGYRHDLVERRARQTPGYTPSRGLAGGKLSDRNFHLNQYSAGMQLNLVSIAFIRAAYLHAERAPDVNELYSGNNHFAIMLEENGDDKLKKETAKTGELSTGINLKGIHLQFSYYQRRFQNYMYLAHTGISRSGGFLVKEWRQADTKLTGWEAEIGYNRALGSKAKLEIASYVDLVQNINVSDDRMRDWAEGDYMPNMPTSRFGFSGGIQVKNLALNIGFDRYLQQRYLGKNINPEPPMPAYTLLNARLAYESSIRGFGVEYFTEGHNLLNTEARPQNSFLKYLAPLPGINIALGIKASII